MQEPRAKSQEPRAKSQEPRAKSQENYDTPLGFVKSPSGFPLLINDTDELKILVCYYQPWEIPKGDIFLPIQAGKAISGFNLKMQGDDTGNNISSKNQAFSEFTAWYWAWKNIKILYPNIKYIGLSHYRRYFLMDQPFIEHTLVHTSNMPNMEKALGNT
ncbi:hypothetical protein FACS1894130_12890 [Spirochaetia bacterium]|nr:hypothetical protein FACS1894130_12890 [Spirochaetia bacterium]